MISLPEASQIRGVPVDRLDRLDLLPQPERHVAAAQEVLERLADLAVEEVEHAVALVDHRDLGAERAEHRRVLDADHAARRRRSCVRGTRRSSRSRPSESMIVRSSKATVCGPRRRRADRDDDALGADRLVEPRDPARCGRPRTRASPGQPADHVAAELLPHDRRLGGDHARGAVHQLLERLLLGLLHPRGVEHVERALGELRRARPRAASSTGSCPCGWRRRRAGRAAPRRRRACRAWRPGSRPSGRDGPEPITRRSRSTAAIFPDRRRCAATESRAYAPCMPVAVVKLGSSRRRRGLRRAAPVRRRARLRGGRGAAPRAASTSSSSPRARSRAGCTCSSCRCARRRSPSCRPPARSGRAGCTAPTTSCCASRGSRPRRCCSRSST